MKIKLMLVSIVLVLLLAGCTQEETIEPEMSIEEIKGNAVDVSYDELMRNSEEYEGEMIHTRGEVIQFIEGYDDTYALRVSVTKEGDEYYEYWTDPVYLEYTGDIVLEKDLVDIWGVSKGTVTYKSALGTHITIPSINALQIEVVTKAENR